MLPFQNNFQLDRGSEWKARDTKDKVRRDGLFVGMVQKGPFSGNTWDLSADSERSCAGAGFGESLVAAPGLQFWENRVYPRSSSQ